MEYLAKQSEMRGDAAVETTTAKLPCHYIPFPPNPKFYGRSLILRQISAQFSRYRSDSRLVKVALWATAGIGKTQIALEHAWRERDAGKQVILWIDAEKETERIKAFNEIAHLLELPGALGPKDSDQNRLLVLRWLQETSKMNLPSYANIIVFPMLFCEASAALPRWLLLLDKRD
jgi:hypothetical protein